jgi:hypothetical protein
VVAAAVATAVATAAGVVLAAAADLVDSTADLAVADSAAAALIPGSFLQILFSRKQKMDSSKFLCQIETRIFGRLNLLNAIAGNVSAAPRFTTWRLLNPSK